MTILTERQSKVRRRDESIFVVVSEDADSIVATACNLASSLVCLRRIEEAKALYCKVIPVARRVLGEGHEITLKLRWGYAQMLFTDPAATHDDLRESVTTLEDAERIARRVFGGTHPDAVDIEHRLRSARAVLHARETQSPGSS